MKIGLIGCGNIANAYVAGCRSYRSLEVVACADIEPERAREKGREHSLRAVSVSELLDDPDLDLVINLTVPAAHTAVTRAILESGKHAYSEKPIALSCVEAKANLALAARRNLRWGCAADTFLGAGLQTCRKLIDDDAIGTPIAAAAFFASPGTEAWHPNPAFYYQPGGGPLLDMGPYYIGALVNLLGPVKRVCASTGRGFAERRITSEPLCGSLIPVEVATHISASLEFHQGAIATLLMSFDVMGHSLPRLEIYGTHGTLGAPDPNNFAGPVRILRPGICGFRDVDLTHPEGSRGVGVADMASAIRTGRPHRASAALAYHLLDVMENILIAGESGEYRVVESRVDRPAPLPLGLRAGELD